MPKRINTQYLNRTMNKGAVKQKGMTFIEVLVAFVIIVTGILGAVAMQANAKKGSFDAMQRSLASSLAQDIVARMRANNPANLAAYAGTDYGGNNYAAPANRCNLFGALCTPAQIVVNDQHEWEQAIMGADVTLAGDSAGGLLGGLGCVFVNANAITVVINWQGKQAMTDANKAAACGATSDKRRQVVVQAFII
ncbi:type IV pilus modification protein PilV [Colwellia sp. E150_009]